MSPKLGVRVEGINQLMAKLRTSKPIYAEPWRKALTAATLLVEERVKHRAPIMTGRLKASVTHRMDTRPVPFYGIVTANAERKGWRYPFSLDAGKGKKRGGEHSITHYRNGPRAGKKTRRWFFGSATGVRKKLSELLGAAAREIETLWNE